MIKTNFHTHSTFCDGKNTMEEMVLGAIEKDFQILGFSSHAMFPFSDDWHIQPHQFESYMDSINQLKAKYQDSIQIYSGFEADWLTGLTSPSRDNYGAFTPDYILGSVHYVPGKEGYFEADGPLDETRERIQKHFGGNVKEAVCTYFEMERQMLRKGGFDILGHCDLIRVQNGKGHLFDESEEWYRNEIRTLAKEIASSGVIAEVNTGAMARGRMADPYPSSELLCLLRENNVPLTLNSDAHTVSGLDFGFEQALKGIKNAGYTELFYFSAGTWKNQNI